jgi:hypothetical protein
LWKIFIGLNKSCDPLRQQSPSALFHVFDLVLSIYQTWPLEVCTMLIKYELKQAEGTIKNVATGQLPTNATQWKRTIQRQNFFEKFAFRNQDVALSSYTRYRI